MMGVALGRMQAGHRVAAFIDVENFVHAYRRDAAFAAATECLLAEIRRVRYRCRQAYMVAVCDGGLAKRLAFDLSAVGARVYRHRGGPDAADGILVEHMLHRLPRSVETVVLFSGDGIFTDPATEMRRRGHRFEVVGLRGHLSRSLRRVADAAREVHAVPIIRAS